jgi:hypothetical protein
VEVVNCGGITTCRNASGVNETDAQVNASRRRELSMNETRSHFSGVFAMRQGAGMLSSHTGATARGFESSCRYEPAEWARTPMPTEASSCGR